MASIQHNAGGEESVIHGTEMIQHRRAPAASRREEPPQRLQSTVSGLSFPVILYRVGIIFRTGGTNPTL